ncbi:DUF6207 family protein [Streptomyces cyaneochromogenes]|uniref:DUF6207 family protein n=1 Tax=Streptomyces cyaneochromogenes TaxID=2496836 RepID=UPI001E46057E|nr:DUF6207 family protein [Streptomyces cyaneochromogenes]
MAACDDQTAFAVQELLAARCAIAPAERTTRDPGDPGVRLRCFLRWPGPRSRSRDRLSVPRMSMAGNLMR